MPRQLDRDSVWIATRPDSRYFYICWYDPVRRKTRWKSCRTTDRATAEKEKAAFLLGANHVVAAAPVPDTSTPAIVLTVGVALAEYYDQYASGLPSRERQEIAKDRFTELWGNLSVFDLTWQRQEEYARKRHSEGVSRATISTELSTLRAAVNYACEARSIKAPVIFDLDRGKTRERWLTHQEAARLLDACRSRHMRLFMRIELETGARPCHVLQLPWVNVNLDSGIIDFAPEGHVETAKRRPVVRVSTELVAELKKAREEARSDFVIEYAGAPIRSIKRAFRLTAREAGLPDVTPYVLRHSVGTWLAQDGVPLWEIAKRLGTSLKMVEKHYAHHHPDFMARSNESIVARLQAVDSHRAPSSEKRPSRRQLLEEREKEAGATASQQQSTGKLPRRRAPQLHHSLNEVPASAPRPNSKKARIPAAGGVVGATGIEPVTPTMST
ncbi:MAG: hypothetical protein BroJett029_22970 [Alphaproteobacteria bacterium]|nr:MAG: hypothetical protein BroJett029_22970 [Alphaproteobacteria bacterium]